MPIADFVMNAEELDREWTKSNRSNPSGNCVEFAALEDGTIAIRNSRSPQGPALIFTKAEAEAFVGGVTDGDFDKFVK